MGWNLDSLLTVEPKDSTVRGFAVPDFFEYLPNSPLHLFLVTKLIYWAIPAFQSHTCNIFLVLPRHLPALFAVFLSVKLVQSGEVETLKR